MAVGHGAHHRAYPGLILVFGRHGKRAQPGALRRIDGSNHRVGDIVRADKQQVKGRIGLEGTQSAVNHDGGSLVPAEEVDGDPRGARLANSHPFVSRGTGGSPFARCDPPGVGARH